MKALLGVIDRVQVEVGRVGRDAICQLLIPSHIKEPRIKDQRSKSKEIEREVLGKNAENIELTRESSKCLYVPNHPSILEQP